MVLPIFAKSDNCRRLNGDRNEGITEGNKMPTIVKQSLFFTFLFYFFLFFSFLSLSCNP